MTPNDATDALEARSGLPDALRVLLDAYPREAWESDAKFSGLIRFWLERHLMFRRVTTMIAADAENALDDAMDPRVFASRLSRQGSMLVGELHGHHSVEDLHYFPVLRTFDPRLERGFDILDRDHHALDRHLTTFADSANAALKATGEGGRARDEIATFHGDLTRLGGFLNRHLADEEDLVVPVLLKHAPAGLV